MTLTTNDILEHEFHVRLRGFDMDEVDSFLEKVAETLHALTEEKEKLRAEISGLKKRYAELQRENRLLEKTMRAAVSVSQAGGRVEQPAADESLAEIHEQIADLEAVIRNLPRDLQAALASQLGKTVPGRAATSPPADDLSDLYEKIELPDDQPGPPGREENPVATKPDPGEKQHPPPDRPLAGEDTLFSSDYEPQDQEPAVILTDDSPDKA